MFSHLTRRVTLAARWILLSCGCPLALHGNAKAPTDCPDCCQAVASSAS
ncbi:hypothetical protein ACWEOZ_23290 [Actinoplanes sp. NPDC004185]